MAVTVQRAEARRVTEACQFCRRSKLKCSGTQPCDRCQKRSKRCVYDDRDDRDDIAGPQERLVRPRKRVRNDVGQGTQPPENEHEQNHVNSRSPVRQSNASRPVDEVVNSSPQFLANRPNKRKRRRWRKTKRPDTNFTTDSTLVYLGASSTWTFNVRVAALIRQHLGAEQNDDIHEFTLDGDAYSVSLKKVNSDTQPDLSYLPSYDYAIYLINTVKFHLGDILRLFDEDEFLQNLHEFYSEGPQKAGTDRLWYTQCLLLLALGKGFLNARKSPDNTSSADFFSRAMSILPDVFTLHEEPVLAVEVLATIALYFYCIDMRQSAYSYIGQALRIALVEGMQVDLLSARIGQHFAERCRKLWWTVYILDRTLSSAVGAPLSVHDEHIRQPLGDPRQSSQPDATLIMHVKLCRTVSFILSELYTADGNLGHSYLTKTRSVLRRIADIAKELEDTIDYKFKSSLETLSKGALYLRLLYNQCIMLTTRPLLLSLLQETFRSISTEKRNRINIPSSIKDLLQTCVDSATKTLKMLWALNEHNLLDTFLPFNLEFACSSASIIIVIDDVLRGIPISTSTKSLINRVLDEIATGGNKAAPLRQRELQQLSRLAGSLWTSVDSGVPTSDIHYPAGNPNISASDAVLQGVSASTLAHQTPQHHDSEPVQSSAPIAEQNTYTSLLFDEAPDLASLSTISSTDMAQTFDFSQEQMLILADHLDSDAMSTSLDFGNHVLDEWF